MADFFLGLQEMSFRSTQMSLIITVICFTMLSLVVLFIFFNMLRRVHKSAKLQLWTIHDTNRGCRVLAIPKSISLTRHCLQPNHYLLSGFLSACMAWKPSYVCSSDTYTYVTVMIGKKDSPFKLIIIVSNKNLQKRCLIFWPRQFQVSTEPMCKKQL